MTLNSDLISFYGLSRTSIAEIAAESRNSRITSKDRILFVLSFMAPTPEITKLKHGII